MASSDRNREEEEEEEEVSMEWIKNPDLKFEPTDEILTDYYLREKAAGRNDGIFGCIKQVDICKFQPSELSSLAYDFGDGKKMMYFVTALKMKYGKGRNVDRLTKDNIGFWKITGNISYVKKDGREIASKTPLAYYINKTSDKPEKSQWLMKEYRLIEDQSNEESERLALCVIYSKSGKGVREEKNKKSSVYEKGEGSNSKTIATDAASSSLPPTENSNHLDNLERLVGIPIPIPYSDQNMLVMEPQGSYYPYPNMPYPVMGSQGSNFVQNIPNQVMGLHGATATDSNLELPSETIADLEYCPLLPTEDSFEYSLGSIPIPIPYSVQNMLVMGSQGSKYPYQNMPYPVMGSQGSNFVQNIPNQEMGLHGATATDSNLELPSETIADLEDCPLLPTEDSFEYSLGSIPIPIPYSVQNMLVMGSQGSNYPYQNMPYPVMGSQGSNFVQNIPNQEMVLHGATATDSNLDMSLETIADLQHWLPLPTEDSCEYQTWKRRRF